MSPTKTQHHPGRNDPCPCGSGRKYKHCCLEKDEAAAREASAGAAGAASPGSGGEAPARPPKHHTDQPWKRSAANTHGFHPRVSTPRKVGSG